MKSKPLIAVVAGAVIAAALLAIAITLAGGGSSQATTVDFDTASAAASGAALAPMPESGTDPAVGQPAPTIKGTDRSGASVTLPTSGRPTIVLFLAHWCPHCQREVPALQRWIDEGQLPTGIDLVAVSTAVDPNRPNYPPSAWLDREGWTPPTVADATGVAAQAYGLTAFPFWVAVDAGGTVVDRRSGELTLSQITEMATLATR